MKTTRFAESEVVFPLQQDETAEAIHDMEQQTPQRLEPDVDLGKHPTS